MIWATTAPLEPTVTGPLTVLVVGMIRTCWAPPVAMM